MERHGFSGAVRLISDSRLRRGTASRKLKQGALSLAANSRSAFILALALAGPLAACAPTSNKGETVLTFSGSALGAEGTLVAKQLKRFMELNPGVRVELQRTPDDASQRHQLYVQWLLSLIHI